MVEQNRVDCHGNAKHLRLTRHSVVIHIITLKRSDYFIFHQQTENAHLVNTGLLQLSIEFNLMKV